MKIVCCSNMPFAREAFETLGTTFSKDGRTITAQDVRDAEILAVRSTTKVDESLLAGSAVRFVGTATIGTDHMDITWLERNGIRWCYAPGCNANSVSEYVTAALLCLSQRHGFALEGRTIGVVGVGNVGSLVAGKARTLGMRVLLNDPPRQRAGDRSENFAPLEQILEEGDIITFHVPLTKQGPDATVHMADERFFASIKRRCLIINSARGPVVSTGALLSALKDRRIAHAVIDTWENEPDFSMELLSRADIATPHIAGHSFEGKVFGTVMVYRTVCDFLGVKPTWSHESLMPPPIVPRIKLDATGKSDESVLWEIVKQVYDIEADDRALRKTDQQNKPGYFDLLRKNYPIRREFRYTRVEIAGASRSLRQKIVGLGFQAA